eukprot:Skav200780  [mRNA]  locus=scaffold2001:561642:567531:+ [translate_table: standard]
MAQWLDYRVRVTISDARMLVGTFMAFDKYMNVVLADCEEFRKIKWPQRSEWDLTDESQSREYLEAQKRLHRQRCNDELDRAQRACDVLITAQGDVRCGKLTLAPRALEEGEG